MRDSKNLAKWFRSWNRQRTFRWLSLAILVLGGIGGALWGGGRPAQTTVLAAAGSKAQAKPSPVPSSQPVTSVTQPVVPTKGTGTVARNASCAGPVPMDAIGGDGLGAKRVGHIHQGYDLMVGLAQPIYAVKDGVVIQTGFNSPTAGTLMKVKHADGTVTWYLHMIPYSWLAEGAKVHKGQVIALIGQEGDSSGPHLHFEVHRSSGREKGQTLNPVAWLKGCGITYKREANHGGL